MRRRAPFGLLLMLVVAPVAPMAAQQRDPIPMDSVVAERLAGAWPPHYQRRDALACFYGRAVDGAIDVDSVRVILTLACNGRGVVGVAGFLDGSGYSRGQVVSGLCDMLRRHAEFAFVGQVRGVVPDGDRLKPQMWACWRAPNAALVLADST